MYSGVSFGDNFIFRYNLSLNVIDLIIPGVIHFDFLCLCLFILTFLSAYI